MGINKIAALDLGTNSFICLIASIDSEGKLITHEESIEQVRIGQGLGREGLISQEALLRADDCLRRFSELCQKHKVSNIRALATSAARDAKNGNDLVAIAQNYKFSLDIISGIEEARYCAQGSLVNLEISDSPVLIVDIGGGSTEFIFLKDKKVVDLQSFNIGAVKLTEKFLSIQPAKEISFHNLSEYLDEELKDYLKKFSIEAEIKIVGIAGTPTSLLAAKYGRFEEEKIHGGILTSVEIENWILNLKKLSSEDIRARYSFGQRSDIILAGTLILNKVLSLLSAPQMIVSTKGVRYGLALEMLQE